jgi:hypothetical protein
MQDAPSRPPTRVQDAGPPTHPILDARCSIHPPPRYRVQGPGSRYQGAGIRAQGSGFRIHPPGRNRYPTTAHPSRQRQVPLFALSVFLRQSEHAFGADNAKGGSSEDRDAGNLTKIRVDYRGHKTLGNLGSVATYFIMAEPAGHWGSHVVFNPLDGYRPGNAVVRRRRMGSENSCALR